MLKFSAPTATVTATVTDGQIEQRDWSKPYCYVLRKVCVTSLKPYPQRGEHSSIIRIDRKTGIAGFGDIVNKYIE